MRSVSIPDAVRRHLDAEPRIDVSRHAIALSFTEGVLTMEGELADLGAKKIALVPRHGDLVPYVPVSSRARGRGC